MDCISLERGGEGDCGAYFTRTAVKGDGMGATMENMCTYCTVQTGREGEKAMRESSSNDSICFLFSLFLALCVLIRFAVMTIMNY